MNSNLLILVSALFLTACAGSGGKGAGSDATVVTPPVTTTPPVTVAPVTPDPTTALPSDPSIPVSPVVTNNIPLTYYKLSRTEAPIGGWSAKTYTATGSCVTYLTKDYCWDDGVKNVVIPGVGTFTYNYWEFQGDNSSWGPCHGACTNSLMASPRYISPTLRTNITAAKINAVFSTGASKNVTCTESSGLLNCVDFVITLNQVAL